MPRKSTQPKAVKLSEAIGLYLDNRRARDMAEKTVYGDQQALKSLCRFMGGDPWMSQVTDQVLEDYFYGPEAPARSLSWGSHNNMRVRFGVFFKYCRQKNWVFTDVMALVDARKKETKERRRLSAAEILSMIDNARWPRDRIAVAVAANTALRASEIFSIRLKDVDLDQSALFVTIDKTREEDTLPISSDLDTELRRWLTHYQDEFPDQPLNPNWYLVPAQWYQRWGTVDGVKVDVNTIQLNPTLKPSNQARIIHRALEDLGWSDFKGEGFHTIRRSVARLFFDSQVAKGYDGALQSTKALLHHKNASMTEHYIGITNEKKNRDVELKGKPFLSAMVTAENVVPLKVVTDG